MQVYVVLFRGVGGPTQLPVKPLREALLEAGFPVVRTYIATGNVILASRLPAERVKAKVARIAGKRLGFTKAVLVLTRAQWAAIVRANPFAAAAKEPRTLHAFVIEAKPGKEALAELAGKAAGSEEFEVRGNALYFHAPDGFGRSKLPAAIEKALEGRTTARNWNTVLRLGAIAGEVAAEARRPSARA